MANAEKLLRVLIDTIAAEQKYEKYTVELEAINSGGANYTSVLFLVDIKIPDKKDVKLFAKVACIGEQLRPLMGASRLFFLETYFYNQLSKIYTDLQLKHQITGKDLYVHPKFYGCNPRLYEETVVLENLIAEGYSSISRFESVNWDQASSAIEALAKFHALSFAYQKEKPEEYEEVCKDLMFVMPDRRGDQAEDFWTKSMGRSLAALKEEHKGPVVEFMKKMGPDIFVKFRKPIIAKAIIHGDYRPSNLLYKKEESKVSTIPVDYQTIQIGSPASDVVYFEVLGTDAAFRAEHHDRLIEHYYSELTAALNRLDVDVNEVYPRDMFDQELRQILPFGLLLGIVILPMVLVEAKNIPRVDGEGAIESFIVESSDAYAERFRGIVEDYVRWGVI